MGLSHDPQLGTMLVVAAGGVLAELLVDRAVALPPVDPGRVENLLRTLKISELLDGWRGSAAVDRAALVRVIVSVGALGAELGSHLAALDINPVFVTTQGATAVDVLVVPRG